MPVTASRPARPRGNLRWIVCALLFAAVVLSYLDRLVLPTLKPLLQTHYGWSEMGYADLAIWFQAAYGIAYLLFGRIVDRFGARIGYAAAISLWTIGHVAHIFFTSTIGMAMARVPLALGEAGTFPAALAATNEWFPKRERALAIGLFNAGSNVGAIVTPLIVPAIAIAWGWRTAFIVTGALSIPWLIIWLVFYRCPRDQPRLSTEERLWIEQDPVEVQRPLPWRTLLRLRQTWAYMLGRFLIDPVWWTLLFWLPDFFSRQYHVRMLDFGPPLVAVYLLADIGSIGGGWMSSRMLGRGFTVNRARKTAMFVCALFALPIIGATHASSLWFAVLLIGLASAGHQGFSANIYALPGDLFPAGAAGSVIGLGGLAGAIGSMAMARFAGTILDSIGSYQPIFAVAGCTYLAALCTIHLLLPRYQPIDARRII